MASYEKRTWWPRNRLSERLANDTFLEAAVNAAFLIAAADGSQSEVEYDALLDRLELLGGIERDKIDEHLSTAARLLEETGPEMRVEHVASLIADRADAEAVMMLGLAIALADDEVTPDERLIAAQLATGMGLGALDLDALIIEIRG
jgi:tellurite resistance protein